MLKQAIRWIAVLIIGTLGSPLSLVANWTTVFKAGAREVGVGVASSVADTALLDAQASLQGADGDNTFDYQLAQCQNLMGVGGLDSYDYQRQCGNMPQLCQQMMYRNPGRPPHPFCMMILGPMMMQQPMPGPGGIPAPGFGIGMPQMMASPMGSMGFPPMGMGAMPAPGGMMSQPYGGYGGGYGSYGGMPMGGMASPMGAMTPVGYGTNAGMGGMGSKSYWEGFGGSLAGNTLASVRRNVAEAAARAQYGPSREDEEE